MRSFPTTLYRLFISVAACLLLWPPSSESVEPGELFSRIAIKPPDRVAFREERYNSLLKEPLVLTGYLEYLGPRKMKKVIETPFRETFSVTEQAVVIERDGAVQKLSLRKSKSLQAMLSSIEAIIAGDEARLAETFNLELQDTQEGWSIRLTPKSKRVARNLDSLFVAGSDDLIRSIRISLGDGEWQLIELLHADAGSSE